MTSVAIASIPTRRPVPVVPARTAALLGIVLAGLVLAVYYPVFGCEFVNYDDDDFIIKNPHVWGGLSWDGFIWGLTTREPHNWHPLTWWSYQLDYQWYGLNPAGYHVTNLLWHIGSTLVLFAALRRLTGDVWPSFLAAALFAVQPLNVQSVAWVAERKGVISAFFWMLTLLAYAWYVERPGSARYALVALSLALGLMAKQMLVTLPCVLLLLDFWPLERAARAGGWRWLSAEKLPLLALALAAGAMTVQAQHDYGAIMGLEKLSWSTRLMNALVSYLAYLRQALVPFDLAAYYPHPGTSLPPWQAALAGVLLLGLTALALGQGRRRPYLTVGWLWYLGTLLPVIGLVQVGSAARADRYTYLPLVGIFIGASWALVAAARRHGQTRLAAALAASVLAGYTLTSWLHVHYWQNSVLLWEQDLHAAGPSAPAYAGLGSAYLSIDREAAFAPLQAAVDLDPDNVLARHNLGMVLLSRGDLAAAEQHFRAVLRLDPDNRGWHANQYAHYNLGSVFMKRGELGAAIAQFRAAIALAPSMARAYSDLGLCLFQQGNVPAATAAFQDAVRIEPGMPALRMNLGTALLEQGRWPEAAAQFQAALRLDADSPQAHSNLGVALLAQGQLDEAIACFRRALSLRPDLAAAHRELASALYEQGHATEARAEYAEATRLEPDWLQKQRLGAWALATHPDAARRNAVQALRLARQVCQATEDQDPRALDTLAAALAEAGRFGAAVAAARQACLVAKDERLAANIDARRRLYEKRQAYRTTQGDAPMDQ